MTALINNQNRGVFTEFLEFLRVLTLKEKNYSPTTIGLAPVHLISSE
jgi:hypothetical protein